MGYQTDFVGYLHVQPALNDTEVDFVNRVSGRCLPLPGGTLRSLEQGVASQLLLAEEAPNGWSNWGACSEGCCLGYDGGDQANHMIEWLKFTMATYLIPGARVAGMAGFEDFACDHVVNGMVVGSRRDNRELYSITVQENEVETELLWPGVSEWSDHSPLAYQGEIDRIREWACAPRLEESRDRARARQVERCVGLDDE